MGDLKLTINATAAPIALGEIGLRLPGIPGSTGTIPTASASVLGGIKVGENLKITDGVLSVDTAALQAYVDTVILGGAS